MGLNKILAVWVFMIFILSTTFVIAPIAGDTIVHKSQPTTHGDNESVDETRENRIAIIDTSYGVIKFELFEHRAPITTSNFINLSNEFFYDGLLFHRVIDDFVIQTGDPNTRDNNPYNDGSGGSSETIPLEIDPELTHVDGAVGMARSTDPDSASSQFYICDGAQHGLDGDYAVFGLVFEGIEVVRKIAAVETWGYKRPLLKDHPIEDVVMYSVFITENNSEYTHSPEKDEDNFWPTWDTPGFEGSVLLIGIIVIILIQRRIRNQR